MSIAFEPRGANIGSEHRRPELDLATHLRRLQTSQLQENPCRLAPLPKNEVIVLYADAARDTVRSLQTKLWGGREPQPPTAPETIRQPR